MKVKLTEEKLREMIRGIVMEAVCANVHNSGRSTSGKSLKKVVAEQNEPLRAINEFTTKEEDAKYLYSLSKLLDLTQSLEGFRELWNGAREELDKYIEIYEKKWNEPFVMNESRKSLKKIVAEQTRKALLEYGTDPTDPNSWPRYASPWEDEQYYDEDKFDVPYFETTVYIGKSDWPEFFEGILGKMNFFRPMLEDIMAEISVTVTIRKNKVFSIQATDIIFDGLDPEQDRFVEERFNARIIEELNRLIQTVGKAPEAVNDQIIDHAWEAANDGEFDTVQDSPDE